MHCSILLCSYTAGHSFDNHSLVNTHKWLLPIAIFAFFVQFRVIILMDWNIWHACMHAWCIIYIHSLAHCAPWYDRIAYHWDGVIRNENGAGEYVHAMGSLRMQFCMQFIYFFLFLARAWMGDCPIGLCTFFSISIRISFIFSIYARTLTLPTSYEAFPNASEESGHIFRIECVFIVLEFFSGSSAITLNMCIILVSRTKYELSLESQCHWALSIA